jgi:O-acetylserine/cysteine efflux transporter
VALAVAVAVVWGLNFVVIDAGLKVFPPLLFVALRFAVVVFPAIFFVGRARVPARYIVGVGAFSGAL